MSMADLARAIGEMVFEEFSEAQIHDIEQRIAHG
jgi:hypothetical protein